jgi:hypothetical protein
MATRRSVRMMLSVTPEVRELLEAYGQRMGIPASTAAVQVLEQHAPVLRAIVDLPGGPMTAALAREGIRQVLGAAIGDDGEADVEAYAAYRQAAERLVETEAEARAWQVVEASRAVRAVVAPTTE